MKASRRLLRDDPRALLLLGLWAAMTLAALFFVALRSSRLPFFDDLDLVFTRAVEGGATRSWLWRLHNEHRIPLPRAVLHALLEITGDIRSGMFLEVLLLSAVAALWMLAARRSRGSSSLVDALPPLVLLHLGTAENLLMAFQVSLILPLAISCAVVLVTCRRSGAATPGSVVLGSALVLGLPLCGGHGLVQVPGFLLWAGLSGWWLRGSDDAARRRAGVLTLAFTAATLLVTAAYFLSYGRPPGMEYAASPGAVLATAFKFLALAFGPAGEAWHPWAASLVVVAGLIAVALLARVARKREEQRIPSLALLALLVAVAALAVSAGIGRGIDPDAGFARRYVPLAAPALLVVHLALARYGAPLAGRILGGVLVVAAILALPAGTADGWRHGAAHWRAAAAFEADLARGAEIPRLAQDHATEFYNSPADFAHRLEVLRAQGFVPFDRLAPWDFEPPAEAAEHAALPSRLISSESPRPIVERPLLGHVALLIHADGALWLQPPHGRRILRGTFGMHPLALQNPMGRVSEGLRFTIELHHPAGPPDLLLDRELDPRANAADSQPQAFEVEMSPRAGTLLRLGVRCVGAPADGIDWAYWSEVRYADAGD